MRNSPSRYFDRATPLLLAKVGTYPRHHGGLGAVRSLGRLGIPAYAMAEDAFTPVALSRYLTKRVARPLKGTEHPDVLVRRLREALRRIGAPVVPLPTDDEAAVLLAEHRTEFADSLLLPSVDPTLPRRLASKLGLAELAAQYGIATPRASSPDSLEELTSFANSGRFPVVMKALEPFTRLERRDLRETALYRSNEDLLAALDPWPGAGRVLLQEYLPAATSEDWIFHGYFNASSECLVGFTGIKHRSWPPQFGLTTYATTATNAVLKEASIAFCQRIGYCGIVDMDWRLDRRDNQYYLLDCNPRVGAQFRLFEDDAGIDVVRAMHLDLTGRTVPAGAQVDGREFLVESLDLGARFAERGLRSFSAGRAASSRRRELAWWSADDPLPFFSMALRQLGPAARRLRASVFHGAKGDNASE